MHTVARPPLDPHPIVVLLTDAITPPPDANDNGPWRKVRERFTHTRKPTTVLHGGRNSILSLRLSATK